MTEVDATALLKAETYLRFHDLRTAPAYGDLTLWVDGAELAERSEPAGTGHADIDRIIGPRRKIETGPGLLRYRIVFEDFIAFTVRDESYALPEEDEDYSTNLRSYRTSRFLTHILQTTFEAYDGPLLHMAVVTADHVIDVATTSEPRITARVIGPDDPGQREGLPDDFR